MTTETELITLEDFKLGLQDVLDRELNFKGSFASDQTYKDFPNPCLTVERLGHIGLPLSQREAQILISECQQAPFGKGTETVVDTQVRKTWQMEPSKVSFENPKWTEFIDKLLCDACKTLGVDYEISKPACELYKLLIYEPGSHFKSHQDTEKSPGMFATMVVILPSKFTGGEVHLKHSDSSEVFTSSENSHLNITSLCWYTDVFHEIKPVETGYRLALSYNLIHKTKAPRPVLPSSDAARTKLESLLRTWADKRMEDVQAKLLYLLEHEYSRSGLKHGIANLKGVDASRVAFISGIGAQFGFRFALVGMEYYVFGVPKNPQHEEDDTIVFINQEKITFTEPVDLEGNPIDIELKDIDTNVRGQSIEDNPEFVPEDIAKKIRDLGDYHDSEKEKYYGNDGGDVQQWYRNTLLVMWHDPNASETAEKEKRDRMDDENDETQQQKRAKIE